MQEKNAELGGIFQIQSIPVGRQEISLPKATPKIDPFFSKFQRIGSATCYIQEWDLQKNGFDYYGSSVIVGNYANDNICSEEDMFTDNIEPIISNGVVTIGEKYIIPKGIVTVSWYWIGDVGQLNTNILNTVL